MMNSEWTYVYQVSCDICMRRVAAPARKRRAAVALALKAGFQSFWKADEADGEKSVWACRICVKDPKILESVSQAATVKTKPATP